MVQSQVVLCVLSVVTGTFPDGTTVGFGSGTRFLVNRGPNEVIHQQQVNGSVRLFRR